MKWYAAHIIMYVKFKDGKQDKYPVWENIFLIRANSDEEAEKKAIQKGHEGEGDSQGSFYWENRAATWVFAGVRKINECINPKRRPDDGTEITYSEIEVYDKKSLSKLVKGESVMILYEE